MEEMKVWGSPSKKTRWPAVKWSVLKWPFLILLAVVLVVLIRAWIFPAGAVHPSAVQEDEFTEKTETLKFCLRLIVIALFVIAWVRVAWWTGAIAEAKGRDQNLFFWLALFFNPIPLIIVASLPGPRAAGALARMPCPRCGESIPAAAKVCRFCNALLTEQDRPRAK